MLAPADSLVYLETNDLGAALQPIVDSKPFTEAAKSKPDLSALKGVQIAVAVTGFETSEEKLTDEHSVGKVRPHFIAIADTHAWNFQAVGFAEKKLGSFVANLYDSEPKLEQIDKNGGKYFTWTAEDGRKAYPLVIDSLIYFTNDETAIDKCLAVRRSEADSIAKTGKVQPSQPGTLASGYISTDGVAQIANIAALKFASDASDESEVQSAIAGIIPQLIRGTVTEVTWTQIKTDAGLEDKWQINMPDNMSRTLAEVMKPAMEKPDPLLLRWVPDNIDSATLYSFENPSMAWNALAGIFDGPSQPMAKLFLQETAAGYGVRSPEAFLASHGGPTLTVHNEDSSILVAPSLSADKNRDVSLTAGLENLTSTVHETSDGVLSGFSFNGTMVIGDSALVGKVNQRFPVVESIGQAFDGKDPVVTVGRDRTATALLVDGFGVEPSGAKAVGSNYIVRTKFNRSGMERKTTSDFGFIGWIIAQVNDE